MMPSLMIDHLSINLRSGTDNLVSEISFAIKEGESLILLGQSGSGKTMMCYVNNSIYADVVPEIGECQRQLMMGAEFCYDAIANPKNYDSSRSRRA